MTARLSPTTRTVLRAAAGIAIAIAAGFATLILFFVGGIEATGCFIECGEPNVLGGSLFLTGAVLTAAIAITSVVWGIVGWQRRVLVKVAGWTAVAATLLVLVVALGAR